MLGTTIKYFGSDKTPTEVAQSNSNGWGSDAGGRFATLNGDMTPEQAKQDLALSPDWGNSAVYRSKMEIPAGTEISVGKAKPQIAADGTICDGGGDQIVLNQPWTDEETITEWLSMSVIILIAPFFTLVFVLKAVIWDRLESKYIFHKRRRSLNRKDKVLQNNTQKVLRR